MARSAADLSTSGGYFFFFFIRLDSLPRKRVCLGGRHSDWPKVVGNPAPGDRNRTNLFQQPVLIAKSAGDSGLNKAETHALRLDSSICRKLRKSVDRLDKLKPRRMAQAWIFS
jgi:hypothetical protein